MSLPGPNARAGVVDPAVIQGLWVGPRLTTMERLSIASFLAHGHDYHLYTYDEVQNVPAGTTLKDGEQVLPRSSIFRYRDRDTVAGFSNFFRYKLLLEHGGWWADTDVVCLAPFAFENAHVFSTEYADGDVIIGSAVIRAPRGSPVMAYAWEACEALDTDHLGWGVVGPELLAKAVIHTGLQASAVDRNVFCPFGYEDWRRAIEPLKDWPFDTTTRAVHLWHEMWRLEGRDKDGQYPRDSLYETLKRRYLDAACEGTA